MKNASKSNYGLCRATARTATVSSSGVPYLETGGTESEIAQTVNELNDAVSEGTSIAKAIVDEDGTALASSGFTTTRQSTGVYRLTFTDNDLTFTQMIVRLTAVFDSATTISYTANSPTLPVTYIDVYLFDDTGAPVNGVFSAEVVPF